MAELSSVLAELRAKMGLSQADLAQALAVAPATVSERERGGVIPPARDMQRMAAAAKAGLLLTEDGWALLDPSVLDRLKAGAYDPAVEIAVKTGQTIDRLEQLTADLKSGNRTISKPGRAGPAVPYYGQVPCGRPLLMEDPPEADLDISAITGGAWDTHDGFVIQADGDSMEPHIRDGDWLVCRRQETWKNWDLVVVFIDGSSTVKQVQPHPDTDRAGEQCLAPLNQRYGPYLDVEGAVVEMYGRVLGKLLYADLR